MGEDREEREGGSMMEGQAMWSPEVASPHCCTCVQMEKRKEPGSQSSL